MGRRRLRQKFTLSGVHGPSEVQFRERVQGSVSWLYRIIMHSSAFVNFISNVFYIVLHKTYNVFFVTDNLCFYIPFLNMKLPLYCLA